jgi:hypothetical protein
MQMMNDKKLSGIYLVAGVGGLALALYILSLGWRLDPDLRRTEWMVSRVLCAFFILVGLLNFCTAYAIGPGRVDEVTGPAKSARLMRDGRLVIGNVRLHFIRRVGLDDPSLTAEQRKVLFVAGWRPMSCRMDRFMVIA